MGTDIVGSDASAAETSANGTQEAANGAQDINEAMGEADGTAENGTEETSIEDSGASDEEEAAGKTAENRQQTLENLERGGDGSKMDFDTKFIYQMRALQDEWNRYEKDKAYPFSGVQNQRKFLKILHDRIKRSPIFVIPQ